MSIRFNPDLYANVLAGLNIDNRDQAVAQQELSTGRRVNQPSDDPAATAVDIGIHAQTSQIDQFTQTISNVSGLMQTADSVMSSVNTVLTQALTLGVQAGNSNLSPSERSTLGSQIQSIAGQVLGFANTVYQGNYIFAGTKSGQQAYVAYPTSATGVTYQGDTGVNKVEISQGQTIAVNQPGSQVFSGGFNDIFAALTNLAQAAQTGNGVSAAIDQLRSA